MSDETKEIEAGEEESSSPGKNRLPLILALVVGITIGAAAGSLIVGPLVAEGGSAAAEGECACAEEEAHAEGGVDSHGNPASAAKPVHTVADVVLNPAGTGGTRYLVMTVAFSVRDSTIVTRMSGRDPEVRDVLLKVIGAKTVDQLADLAHRAALKEEVRANVVRLFGDRSVNDVFFPQFVIQ